MTSNTSSSTLTDFQKLSNDIQELKTNLANMYLPRHFDNMMKKVGDIEHNVEAAERHMSHCYAVVWFTFFLFVALFIGVIWMLWRLNILRAWFSGSVVSPKQKRDRPLRLSNRAPNRRPDRPYFSSPESSHKVESSYGHVESESGSESSTA